MDSISLILIGVGSIVSLIAGFLLLINAFRTHIGWGIASLLLPGAMLVYCIVYWGRAKNLFLISIGATLMAGIGLYMLVNQDLKNAPTSNTDVEMSALSDPENTEIQLPDSPPAAGRCAGWQNSLKRGSTDKIATVEECLEKLARQDRASAIQDAETLQTWDIHGKNGAQLKVLASTLAKFPSDDALRNYLSTLHLLKQPQSKDPDNQPSLTANSFLEHEGNIHWFDVETGMFPNEHNALLADLAALSKAFKDFTFEEIAPEGDEESEAPYKLLAKGKGKKYEQEAQNFGDWYDVDAVLTLLNTIAEDIQANDRFLVLPTGDQTAIVLAIPQDALATLLAQNLIYVEDASVSRLAGKAFEQEMRDQLKDKAIVE